MRFRSVGLEIEVSLVGLGSLGRPARLPQHLTQRVVRVRVVLPEGDHLPELRRGLLQFALRLQRDPQVVARFQVGRFGSDDFAVFLNRAVQIAFGL